MPTSLRILQLRALIVLACTLGIAQAQPPAAPQPASPITDQFAVRANYLFGTANTDGRVDNAATGTLGTPFSLENDFNLAPRAHQARVEMLFRLRDRNRLRVDTWELNRTAVASPKNNVTYGGNTFTPTDSVHSRLDWRQIDFTYTYSFLRRERYELGAGLGLHLLQAEAEALVAQGAGRPNAVRENFNGAGPFVTLALDGSWRFTRRFTFSARGQYMRLHVSSVSAALSDYHADVQFRWRPNFAVGLGYQSTQTDLEVTGSGDNGFMNLAVKGPELFLRASF